MFAHSFHSREEYIAFALVCEEGKRFPEMISCLLAFASSSFAKWDSDERVLLSVAFKGVIRPLRLSISSFTTQLTSKQFESDGVKTALLSIREKMMDELETYCADFISLLEKKVLLESAFQNDEAIIWAYKSVGDHRRYEAELHLFAGRESCAKSKDLATNAYSQGMKDALIKLKPTSVLRLSLALNFASFKFEILKDPDSARQLVQETLEIAETELLLMPHQEHSSSANGGNHTSDTEQIMRMLVHFLDQWKKQ